MASQSSLIACPNLYGDKWEANASQNCMHKALLIDWDNAFPITIGQMPPEGLAKIKSQLSPRTQATNLRMWLVATWEHN